MHLSCNVFTNSLSQALDPAKAKKSEILDYQTDMTSLILKLNDLAVKVCKSIMNNLCNLVILSELLQVISHG
jgi:uncharacterized protein YkvS